MILLNHCSTLRRALSTRGGESGGMRRFSVPLNRPHVMEPFQPSEARDRAKEAFIRANLEKIVKAITYKTLIAAAIDKVDQGWYESDFIPTVQQRGAAIIKARGASSAAARRSRARRVRRKPGTGMRTDGRPLSSRKP